MTRTVKVAVVGTGLAGLTAAHFLKRPLEGADTDVEFEVHVFEKVRFSYRLLAMPNRDKDPFDWYGFLVHFTYGSWLEGRLAS